MMFFHYELLQALGAAEVFRLMRIAPDGRRLPKSDQHWTDADGNPWESVGRRSGLPARHSGRLMA